MELTDKQQQFYEYLQERMDEEGRIPSLRQTAVELGVSHTAVAQMMNQLEKKCSQARGTVRQDCSPLWHLG